MNKGLFISDQRMLLFMEYCVENGLAGITTNRDWFDRIGLEYNNMDKVKKGIRGFSKHHLKAAGDLGASMDFLYGFSDDMLRSKKNLTPIQLIKAGLRLIESEQKGRKRPAVKKSAVRKR